MTDKKKFIIGSRGSKLSLAYSNYVKNLLIKYNSEFDDNSIDIKIIKTSGDIFHNKRISDIGGKGVFCKQIEEELLESKIDLAVHSLKDLPTKMTDGLCVNAVVKRNDPRDAFLSYSSKSFKELKPHSKIGTSSFRRHAQLNQLRNDLKIINMRGNIDTRIKKLNEGLYDGIVLALAGVKNLNLEKNVKEIFSSDSVIPAVGQGVIAVQCRNEDQEIKGILNKINNTETKLCALAERSFLKTLGGDCDTAVGCSAILNRDNIELKAQLFSDDGNKVFNVIKTGKLNQPQALGKVAGEEILQKSGNSFVKKR